MKVAFVGLGKLGMPCAEAIAKKGIDVTGFDTTNKKSDLRYKNQSHYTGCSSDRLG